MLVVLFANGAPAPFPQSASSIAEWGIWGACLGLAALLGGWALLNRNQPSRDVPVGIALLVALVLVAGATLFAISRNHGRQMDQNRQEREQREPETREPETREPEHLPPPG